MDHLLRNKRVSILMCFYERPSFLKLIIHNVRNQTFVQKYPGQVEFVIADDSIEPYQLDSEALCNELKGIVDDITYIRLADKLTIGQKRNLLCEKAKYGVVIFMDDDDYYFPTYIEYSLSELFRRRKALVGSNSMLFCYTQSDYKKMSINCISPRQIHEATVCMLKSHWQQTGGFEIKGNGEGAKLIDGHETKVNPKLDISKIMVCICHPKNTCNKALFVNVGSPAEYPFSDDLKALVDECIAHPLYASRVRLCFKYATRSRPVQFMRTFSRYVEYLSGKYDVHFVVSMDVDDVSMNNDDIRTFLNDYRKQFQIEYYYGTSRNKVDALNRDMVAPTMDVLVLISDDMIPQEKGYDDVIVQAFQAHFPDYDGMLNFNDGLRTDWPKLCTLTVYGIKYYQRFGYIYHPHYDSVYCDQEQTEVGRILKRIKDIDRVIIRHEWTDPAYQDELRNKCESAQLYQKDHAVFQSRAATNFGLIRNGDDRSGWTTPPPIPPAIVNGGQHAGQPPVPPPSSSSLSETPVLLTVVVIANDAKVLYERVEQLRASFSNCTVVAVHGHYDTTSQVFKFTYLQALAHTVSSTYVTFHFPNEHFSPNYIDRLHPYLTDESKKYGIISFDQRCSFDGGKNTFVVRCDAMNTVTENIDIPLRGPWQQRYDRKLCNWNVFRTELFTSLPRTCDDQELSRGLLSKLRNSGLTCGRIDDVLYGFIALVSNQ